MSDALVPSFILQTLIENAIRRGMSAMLQNGYVHLCASHMGDRLKIVVEDVGAGLPQDRRLLENHAGITCRLAVQAQ